VGAEFLESQLLATAGFRHAFFTRRGGYSPPPVDSLHFGPQGNPAETLAANVRAAAAALGIDAAQLYVVTQVHGCDVAVVQGDEDRADVMGERADVVVTRAPGSASGVKTADCVPVLVADRQSGAVAAIHSGWQGTVRGVVSAGIEGLRREIGERGDLVAAIGPHIEVCCFEVDDDVAEKLQACAPGEVVVDRARGAKPRIDLRKIVRGQLLAAGLDHSSIDDVRGCTKCDPERFFSFRRDRDDSGRLLAAVVARSASA
jgi:YfiH family protein